MEVVKNIVLFILALAFVIGILMIKVWLVATGVSMIIGIPVPLYPVALILCGLSFGVSGLGSRD